MTLLSLLVLTIVSTLVCYGVGFLIIYLCRARTQDLFEIFFACVVGLSMLTSAYALIITKGQTVLGFLPMLLAGVMWYRRQNPDGVPVPAIKREPIQWVGVLAMLVAAVVFAAMRYAISRNALNEHIMTALQDYVFYSKTTYALNLKGVEYPFLNPLATGNLNPQPYHFFDLWANALLVKLTDVPSMLVLNVVVYSTLLAVGVIGFAAMYGRYITRLPVVFALAFLSVFTCDTYLFFFHYIHFLQGSAAMNIFTMPVVHPKIIPVVLFLSLGYYFLLDGRYVAAIWAWAALAMVYTVVAPAAYVGGGSFVIYMLIRKQLALAKAAQAMAAYAFVAVYVGGFYWLSSHLHPNKEEHILSYFQYLPAPHDLRTVFNNVIGILLGLLFSYALYLLLIGVLLVKSRKFVAVIREYEAVLVSIVLFAGAAACAGSVFFHATDGFQLAVNLLLPLVAVFLVIGLGLALQRSSIKSQAFAIVFLVGMVAYNLRAVAIPPYPLTTFNASYGADFVRQVAAIAPSLSRHGALMEDATEFTKVFSLNSDISKIGTFIALVRDNTLLVSLSTADMNSRQEPFRGDTALANHFLQNAPFNQFVTQQRRSGCFSTMAAAQRDFLTQNGINFICTSGRVHLPLLLQQLVAHTLVDPVSHQKLYVLNLPVPPNAQTVPEQAVDYVWD